LVKTFLVKKGKSMTGFLSYSVFNMLS